MSENEEIIQFDDGDHDPPYKQSNNFQEEEIIHEPGMSHIHRQVDTLPQLERPQTAAYQMQIRQQQQQQIQQYQPPPQQEIHRQQSDDSVSDTDNRNEVNQSIVNFQSECGDQPGDQEFHQQQVQPNMLALQPINDNEQQEQIQNQQPLNSASQVRAAVNPFPPKMDYNLLKLELEDPERRRNFLVTPLQKGFTLQCSIRRDKSGLARLYPVYHVYTTDGELYLFSAKKVVMNTTSNYVISMDKREFSTRKSAFLGKVRSNFLGTEFMLWDEGKNFKKCKDTSQIRTQLGVVYYESHIMQNKGPRKMKVLLPKVAAESNIAKVFQPLHSNEGIQFDYQNNKRDYIEEFINKPPRWDGKMKAHVLNFYGRVDQPSVKNFQLVKPTDLNFIYLQFGRVDDLLFNLDFCWPITPLQAFQICVTSFDFKFACE